MGLAPGQSSIYHVGQHLIGVDDWVAFLLAPRAVRFFHMTQKSTPVVSAATFSGILPRYEASLKLFCAAAPEKSYR